MAHMGPLPFKATPLPETRAELEAQRKSMRDRTINDYVEDVHLELWDNPFYRKALNAVTDASAMEGSVTADNFVAATMIRARANEAGKPRAVIDATLQSIVTALQVVMRRYKIARKDRIYLLGGEQYPPNPNEEPPFDTPKKPGR